MGKKNHVISVESVKLSPAGRGTEIVEQASVWQG